jgi:hypothetical protein
MDSLEVFTQNELEDALRRESAIPVCAGDGRFEVGGDRFVRAADAAHVVVRDSAAVEAGGQVTVVADGAAHVTARDGVSVELRGSARAHAYGHASVNASDEAWVSAHDHAIVHARGATAVSAQELAAVTAAEHCSVRALGQVRAWLSDAARGWAWGSAAVVAADDARVTAWGAATVRATGAARVEALEHAFVDAAGESRVTAFGDTLVRLRGPAAATAQSGATVVQLGRSAERTSAKTAPPNRRGGAAEWCAYYGVVVEDGVATLYKAVEEDFRSYHGGSYAPGGLPEAPDWDGGEQECGGGLHFAPRPTFGLLHPDDRARFVACPVRVDEIFVHPRARDPRKVKAPRVCAPVYEVREDGTPV